MPPKRPPPLSPALFMDGGPLSPGSAPPMPPASSIHPEYIIDAHSFANNASPVESPGAIFSQLPAGYPRPPVKHAVQVKLDVSADPASSVLGVKPFSIHPTILNLTLATPPSITNIAKGAVDIIVPSTQPMTEKEWDLLDEAVGALDDCWQPVATKKSDGEASSPIEPGKIIISGILPPPLTKPSTPLLSDEAYNLHVARLTTLSLRANVYLKVLPPVVEASSENKWWQEKQELERVLRMYLSPAIEAFGTHRIIFGSFPALPLAELSKARLQPVDLEQPISSEEWYTILRKCVSELGEQVPAMNDIMGKNASGAYSLN